MTSNTILLGIAVYMLEANTSRQDEFNIKKQVVNTLAFSKSNGTLALFLPAKMSIPTVTYGFVLESDYADVRRWALTGKPPKNKAYLEVLLRIDGLMVERWVKFNEAHRRMIADTQEAITRPFLGYMEFCDQYLRVEQMATAF